ncbi:MAG: gliding motility-associated C-terminal domain-containing protein, partial [Sphingobacteriales bacterium]
ATNNPPVTITGNAVVCLGESVTLSAAGGTGIFSWTSSTGLNGSFTQNLVVTPTTTTTYTFTSQSLTGCLTTTSTTVTVTVTPPPTITITSSHPSPVCGSQQVTLTASGASTYSWSTGQTGAVITVTPQTAYTSTYFVTGSNAPGCSDTASISITSIPIIIVTASAASQDICAGESTFLTAAGADSYSWSTGQTGAVIPVSPTSTTTYTVKGSVGSCFNISTVAVNVTPLPAVTTTAALPVVCPGAGGTTLTASGATTYSWTPDPTLNTTTGSVVTANPLVPTTYTVTGTTNGCSNSATILIGTQSSLSVAITAQPGAVCAGQQVSLSATGANSFVWSTGQPGSVISVHPLATTTYSVVGTSGTCTGTNSITITVQPEPVITVIASQQTVCAGEPATLSATGATGYSWSTGQTGTPIQVYPSETTTYSVIGTIGSCSSQPAASTITVTPLPVVAISAPASEICPGDSVMLTANGATSYVWVSDVSLTNISGNTATAAPATTTTFSVTGKTGNCTSLISEFTLNVVAPGVAEAGEEITTNCGQTSVQLMAQTPSQGTGTWTVKSGTGGIIESSSSPATTFSGLAGQTYVLYWAVETICGAGQDSVLVNFSDVPDVWAGSDATILLGESVQLSASGGVSYTWSPATGLSDSGIANPFASPEATTTYTVTATSADGCAASGMVTVAVTYNDLMVPNVFTPNGDGVNDTWAIEGLQVVYPNCEVQVFNRWGVKVFSSKGYTRNWDGGELSTGVYFYHISLGNGEKDVKGHLSIIR